MQSVALQTLGTIVDMNAPLMAAGVDSLSVAELVNALSAALGVEMSATELFDHPTLDSIVASLSTESASSDATRDRSGSRCDVLERAASGPSNAKDEHVNTSSWSSEVAGRLSSASELRVLSTRAFAANTRVPAARWAMPTPDVSPASSYGSFASVDQLHVD